MRKARLDRFVTIEDLPHVARRRIPKVTLGYLESAGGEKGEIARRLGINNLTELRPRGASGPKKIQILEADRVSVRSDAPAIADFR